jgi:hypothetical protein
MYLLVFMDFSASKFEAFRAKSYFDNVNWRGPEWQAMVVVYNNLTNYSAAATLLCD